MLRKSCTRTRASEIQAVDSQVSQGCIARLLISDLFARTPFSTRTVTTFRFAMPRFARFIVARLSSRFCRRSNRPLYTVIYSTPLSSVTRSRCISSKITSSPMPQFFRCLRGNTMVLRLLFDVLLTVNSRRGWPTTRFYWIRAALSRSTDYRGLLVAAWTLSFEITESTRISCIIN